MAKEDKSIKKFPNLRFPGFTDEWKIKKLGDLATISSGGTPSRANPLYWNGIIPWVSTSLIDFNFIEKTEEYITEAGLKNSSAKLFPVGTLLMAMYGQGKTRGKIAILNIEATTNQACGAIITNKKILDANFAFQNLVKRYDEIRELSNQGGQENLSGGIIKGIEMKFSNLNEQKKITSFLSILDERISTQKKTIDKLETSMKGLRKKIFIQELRFKDDNGNYFPTWKIDKLKNLSEIKKGEQLNKDELNDKEFYPCLNGGINFSGYTHKYNSEENTITISEGGNSCGYINFMQTKFWLGGHCYKIIVKGNFVNKYFYHLLKFSEKYIMNLRVGSGLPNIQQKDLKNLDLFVTHENNEQIKIANFLNSIDEKIETEKKILELYTLQKKYLLSNLFI